MNGYMELLFAHAGGVRLCTLLRMLHCAVGRQKQLPVHSDTWRLGDPGMILLAN